MWWPWAVRRGPGAWQRAVCVVTAAAVVKLPKLESPGCAPDYFVNLLGSRKECAPQPNAKGSAAHADTSTQLPGGMGAGACAGAGLLSAGPRCAAAPPDNAYRI